jgi:hypothetical protein
MFLEEADIVSPQWQQAHRGVLWPSMKNLSPNSLQINDFLRPRFEVEDDVVRTALPRSRHDFCK